MDSDIFHVNILHVVPLFSLDYTRVRTYVRFDSDVSLEIIYFQWYSSRGSIFSPYITVNLHLTSTLQSANNARGAK